MNYLRKLKDYVLGEVWLLTLPFSLHMRAMIPGIRHLSHIMLFRILRRSQTSHPKQARPQTMAPLALCAK